MWFFWLGLCVLAALVGDSPGNKKREEEMGWALLATVYLGLGNILDHREEVN
jgi:hypothetical protein